MSERWLTILNVDAEAWGTSLWRAAWQGGVAILLLGTLCKLWPQLSARVQCWLWRLVYLKLLIAFVWATPVVVPLLHAPLAQVTPSAPLPAQPPLSAGHIPRPAVPRMPGRASVRLERTSISPLAVVMILWFGGATMIGAQILREWLSTRLTGCGKPLDTDTSQELAADFKALRVQCGLRLPISLRIAEAANSPYVYGVFRPAIVLPTTLLAPSNRAGLRGILAHEIAHVRRQDLLWNWLPAIVHMLLWFHPLVWLANREWQSAQEMACDEMALLQPHADAGDYAALLVQMVAPARRSRAYGIAALGIAETPQTLKRRLIAMKSIHAVTRRHLVLAGSTCGLLGLLGIVPWQVVAQGTKQARILFVSNRADARRFNIYAMDPDGSHVTRLTHGNGMELDPVWSPDGKHIAFDVIIPQSHEPNYGVKTQLCIMNADGTGRKELPYMSEGCMASPAWSPDGKRLAYAQVVWQDGTPMGIATTLYMINSDGTGAKRLGPGMSPTWSPDGKSLLYSSFGSAEDANLPTLYQMDADGHNVRKLRDHALQGALSPDGSRLAYAFMKDVDSLPAIWISRADGSLPQPLTGKGARGALGPQWSADGKRIFFTRALSQSTQKAENTQICVIDADGSHLQNLTRGDAPDYLGSAPGIFLMVDWLDHLATAK